MRCGSGIGRLVALTHTSPGTATDARHIQWSKAVSDHQDQPAGEIDEARAFDLVTQAIESIGGPQNIYRNPRMAYALNAVRDIEVEGHSVEIRYGEISTPAIATVYGWVYEIHDQDIELLMKPIRKRS
jgi:hypothetical protein